MTVCRQMSNLPEVLKNLKKPYQVLIGDVATLESFFQVRMRIG